MFQFHWSYVWSQPTRSLPRIYDFYFFILCFDKFKACSMQIVKFWHCDILLHTYIIKGCVLWGLVRSETLSYFKQENGTQLHPLHSVRRNVILLGSHSDFILLASRSWATQSRLLSSKSDGILFLIMNIHLVGYQWSRTQGMCPNWLIGKQRPQDLQVDMGGMIFGMDTCFPGTNRIISIASIALRESEFRRWNERQRVWLRSQNISYRI